MPLLTVSEASKILSEGGLIIYPTETFLALGAAATAATAITAIYQIKGRPLQKPLPLISSSLKQVAAWVDTNSCPPTLLSTFWPGPLTILLPAHKPLSPRLTGSQNKLAIRVSASETARGLAHAAGALITATSANLAGQSPCSQITALDRKLLAACAASGLPWGIVNESNPCHYEAPSTVVEPQGTQTGWTLKILRPGAIPKAALASSNWRLI